MATTKKPKSCRVQTTADRCKGCQLCVSFCPRKVLELSGDRLNCRGFPYVVVARPGDCSGCVICATVCPDGVFEIFVEAQT